MKVQRAPVWAEWIDTPVDALAASDVQVMDGPGKAVIWVGSDPLGAFHSSLARIDRPHKFHSAPRHWSKRLVEDISRTSGIMVLLGLITIALYPIL